MMRDVRYGESVTAESSAAIHQPNFDRRIEIISKYAPLSFAPAAKSAIHDCLVAHDVSARPRSGCWDCVCRACVEHSFCGHTAASEMAAAASAAVECKIDVVSERRWQAFRAVGGGGGDSAWSLVDTPSVPSLLSSPLQHERTQRSSPAVASVCFVSGCTWCLHCRCRFMHYRRQLDWLNLGCYAGYPTLARSMPANCTYS